MIQLGLDLSDYPEWDAIAAILYIDGCDRGCPACHNPILQRKQYPEYAEETASIIAGIRRYLDVRGLDKLVLTGGDPLYTGNVEFTLDIINWLPTIDICVYTGADIDEINAKIPLSSNVKYIKGGRFLKEFAVHPLRTPRGLQLASTNQFFLDQKREVVSKEGFLQWKKR